MAATSPSASAGPAATTPSPTTPAEPPATAPTEATPSEPAQPTPLDPPAETPPADEPSAQPTSAGPTPPSETTKHAPTTADSTPIGSRSPRPSTKDEATVLEGSPERMRPMQKAGWWTLFGGFVVATVGGVMSGLAEREEDKAERLAVRFDLDTSAQPLYEDVRGDYEKILDRGEAYASSAIALGVIGGALAVAGITLLAVDEVRLRKQGKGKRRGGKRRAKLELRRGLQVRF